MFTRLSVKKTASSDFDSAQAAILALKASPSDGPTEFNYVAGRIGFDPDLQSEVARLGKSKGCTAVAKIQKGILHHTVTITVTGPAPKKLAFLVGFQAMVVAYLSDDLVTQEGEAEGEGPEPKEGEGEGHGDHGEHDDDPLSDPGFGAHDLSTPFDMAGPTDDGGSGAFASRRPRS